MHPSHSSEGPSHQDRGFQDQPMRFIDHLLELRGRLITAMIAVVGCTAFALIFNKPILNLMLEPLHGLNRSYRLKNTSDTKAETGAQVNEANTILFHVSSPFSLLFMALKVGLWAGLVLASPLVLYELWAFLVPGLSARERKALRPILAGGVLCFASGVLFCYWIIFPVVLKFLVGMQFEYNVQPNFTLEGYLGPFLTMMLMFGFLFEIPLIISVLAALNILDPALLTRYWRYVTLGGFLLGTLLSPGPDPVSMLMMTATILSLYLLSILLARLLYSGQRNHLTNSALSVLAISALGFGISLGKRSNRA